MAQPDDLTKAAGRPLEAISKLFKLEVLADCYATLRDFMEKFDQKKLN
jgi:hypothetical protein